MTAILILGICLLTLVVCAVSYAAGYIIGYSDGSAWTKAQLQKKDLES